MKHKKYTFKSKTLSSLLMLFISSLAFNVYAQGPCPDAPIYDTNQYFCSEAAWAQIGEDADYLGDLAIYADDASYTLTWYRDADLTNKVVDPKTELLIDGNSYYITQTNTDSCQSDALRIVVSETDCGCIKDAAFEDQEGNPSARGYEFYRFQGVSNHKTCGQSMEGATQVQLGAVDGYSLQDNIALVTKGNDNIISGMSRTNPNNINSTHALRINRAVEGGGGNENISSMSKKFIAGEIFSFSFSLVLEDPGHLYHEQPFAQVNLYDENDNLIQSRCLVSDSYDCIFKTEGQFLLYSDWTCMKMNTMSYIGQPLRAEFITAYCTPLAHYSFMYVDDLYAGDDSDEICGDSAFGYAMVNSVSSAVETCYIQPTQSEMDYCDTSQTSNLPGFPVYVCGVYDAPISQGPYAALDKLVLNIVQDGIVVGTIEKPQEGTSLNTFCFLVNESDLDVLPYGDFIFQVAIDFLMDCGNEYYFHVNDRAAYDFCPSAGCPDMLQVCDLTGNGFTVFDLTDHGDMFYGTRWTENDVKTSYYLTEKGAHAQDSADEIIGQDRVAFENTLAYNQTVYIRLDWDVAGASPDCYYLVPLDLEVMHIPILEKWEDEVIYCVGEEINYPLMATPENIKDLKFINYKWYKDGVQIPFSESVYFATSPGVYKVVVSEETCEVEQTIVIARYGLSLELPHSDIQVCDKDSYTIQPTVKSTGDTPADLDKVEYLWNTGATTKDLTVTESGTYTVEVSYEGCIYHASMYVSLVTRPEIASVEDIILCKNTQEMVILDINHPNLQGLHIQWYLDGGLIAENVTQLEVSRAGIYKVVAGEKTAEDCHEEMRFTVAYYDNENCIVPEGLSPNNDGINDNLDLEYLHDKSGISSLKIYNRYGQEVYTKSDYINEWHGQSKDNKILPVGVYYYIIKLKDGSEDISGNIYLNY